MFLRRWLRKRPPFYYQFLYDTISFGAIKFGENAFIAYELVFQKMRASKANKDAGEETKRSPYQERQFYNYVDSDPGYKRRSTGSFVLHRLAVLTPGNTYGYLTV